MCILKPLDVVDWRFISFMCDLLKSPVISTFVRKGYVCIMWLQFLNALYFTFWELSNQYSSLYINICMQKIPDGLFCVLFNLIPSYLWIIYNYFTSFCVFWRYHLQWFYKCEKINPALKRILIHFKPDDLWFIRCRQQLFR